MFETSAAGTRREFSLRPFTRTRSDHWTCEACGQPHLYFEPVERPGACMNCGARGLQSESHLILGLLARMGLGDPRKPAGVRHGGGRERP
jgi:hypothetical protein